MPLNYNYIGTMSNTYYESIGDCVKSNQSIQYSSCLFNDSDDTYTSKSNPEILFIYNYDKFRTHQQSDHDLECISSIETLFGNQFVHPPIKVVGDTMN